MRTRTAVALVPHTGWAWLVRVRSGAGGGAAIVEARCRLVALDVLAAQLYHRTADHPDPADRSRFLADERARVLAITVASLAIADGAGAAVVVGKRSGQPTLDAVLSSHPRIHGAEGELWRALFAEALASRGVAVERAVPDAARGVLEARYGAAAVAAWLSAAGRSLGPPWGKEPRQAALAAWLMLDTWAAD